VVLKMKQAPIMAVQPTGEQVELAAVVTAPPEDLQVATTPLPVADTLPATASPLPLIGLIGLIALCGAFSLRVTATRVR
jgi:hypothetical protein